MELPILDSVFVNQTGDFYVVTAILRDLQQLALSKPLNRLQAFSGFFDPKSRRGDRIQREAMLQLVLQLDKHVERRQLAQIQHRVTVQDFIIEAQMVKADHKISP